MVKEIKNKYSVEDVLFRVLVLIVSGIIFYFWNIITAICFVLNLIITLFTKAPNKDILAFTSYWLTEITALLKYLLFISNEKPFPFKNL